METGRQKLIAAVLCTLIPCSARTVVILGLVAATVGVWWALALYLFDLVLIGVVGRIGTRVLPGTSTGLVTEMPDYHIPSLRVVLAQTWMRTRSLFVMVLPAYVLSSALLQVAYSAGWLDLLSGLLAPVTTGWLGLPAIAGVVILAGMVRKELTILMLDVIMGTTDMATVLAPVQLVVLALVTMISVPCVATLAALAREFGWGRTGAIAVAETGLALLLGGFAFRLLGPILGAA